MLCSSHCTSVAGCTCALFLPTDWEGTKQLAVVMHGLLLCMFRCQLGAGSVSALCMLGGRGLKQPARNGSRLCSLYALCMSVPDSFVCLQAAG